MNKKAGSRQCRLLNCPFIGNGGFSISMTMFLFQTRQSTENTNPVILPFVRTFGQ